MALCPWHSGGSAAATQSRPLLETCLLPTGGLSTPTASWGRGLSPAARGHHLALSLGGRGHHGAGDKPLPAVQGGYINDMATVLAISAHPDDESGFAGGLLARYAEEGHQVYILETTRGEGGEVGDPPVGPKERLGEYREQETRCAAAALGVVELRFLGFVDPSIEVGEPGRAIAAGMEEFASAIARQIQEIQPDILVTHGTNGEYGHPQHIYTHQAVRHALRGLNPWIPHEVLTWCANTGSNAEDRLTNRDDPADFTLELEGTDWFERKVAAMECHRSQHAMFFRNTGANSVREMVRGTEAFRRWSREELLAPEEGAPAAAGEMTSDWTLPGAQD